MRRRLGGEGSSGISIVVGVVLAGHGGSSL